MQADKDFPSDTADLRGARAALAETRRSSRKTDELVKDAHATFAVARQLRETNHFTDKFRAIIRGTP